MANFNRSNRRNTWQRPNVVTRSSYRSPYENNTPAYYSTMVRPPRRQRENPFTALLSRFSLRGALVMAAIGVITCFVLGLVLLNRPDKARADSGDGSAASPASQMEALLEEESPSGKITILLLGSDRRETDGSYRTDVLLLLSIDGDGGTISAVSFPRDLWVRVPPNDQMKINMVHEQGGFKSTAAMFEDNFGVRPDYYVMTDFTGFQTFIDEIGGITVEASKELTDDCDLPQARDGDCTVDPGEIYMDGATALWYVRSRNTSNDLDRLRRAQEVVYAVFKQMMNNGQLDQVAALQKQFKEHIQTNLSATRAISLLPVAARVFKDPDKIKRFAVTEEQATPSWSWNGMWILLPDEAAIRALLAEAGF